MRRSFLSLSGLITILSITALFTIACGGNSSTSSAPEPDKLVPATSNVIGQIEVSRILSGVDFTSLYGDVPKMRMPLKISLRCWKPPSKKQEWISQP